MSPFSRFAVYFAEVARSGSLRKAAEKLHVSASAINRQILQAEESFGTALFERLPDGLRMTTAGELLYDDVMRWQREFRVTRQRFDDIQGLKRGNVSAGLVQSLTKGKVADALADIARQHQWLRLELTVDNSHAISQRIRQSEIDFGLILDPAGQSGLDVLAFAELEMGVVLPPQHALSGRNALSLSELSGERHIIPGESLVVHERVAALYRKQGMAPDNIIACNDIRLIRSLVAQGTGICVLSLLDVMSEVEEQQLCFVPLKNSVLRPLTLALCTAPSRQLSRAAQQVIQRITAVIEEMTPQQHR
ncbi:LysR family transcriptional regulator [Pantoea phytobeneficialis]|uniref:LysR family transcriptional regulator n=1 Tax=Pantoea phytobeneficialis TaxID=2052056 RepID=A0AAP9HAL4_9GAMM|nr:LysR family transcriptional regulator [Pantoea phytobeneficialis]MDO6406805.1 LysR family transcriptional regulator [Pantoea phytobeneficialis]QGR09331.1 LysR family transcriptional regulator [Pantoea phytobeneficialis]